ncbi:UbiX family flavin prenyltransferase [Actinophytocola sp.]|uniref:UbiX family flavin prenyltransferase n=1 Tax=Actinophytocola sp. TaxID=1872138 RepID=UPI003D6B414C
MRIVVGITGASGSILGVRLLEALGMLEVSTHLVLSRWGRATLEMETGYSAREVGALADHVHPPGDLSAVIASGSFRTDGMVIAPCSTKTLAAIHSGYGEGLIARAADVTLKERRKLVLMPRELPLSEVHLRNLFGLSQLGVVIAPPMPAFYLKPNSVDDVVDHIVSRVLDQFGLEVPDTPRWTGRMKAHGNGASPWT